jgi:hypothetical protein
MSSLKELRASSGPAPVADAARDLAAELLRHASGVLARLAADLVRAPIAPRAEPRFEYHAEAGAPEGALYVDGRLVGWIAGVNRL